jgi:hypothetical protein
MLFTLISSFDLLTLDPIPKFVLAIKGKWWNIDGIYSGIPNTENIITAVITDVVQLFSILCPRFSESVLVLQ